MKRLIVVFLICVLLLCGCSPAQVDITREDIIAAYEAADYSVWSDVYDEKMEHGSIAYIQANHPDGDYIYFTFFETEEEAKAYEKELDHPITKGLFSLIYGKPMWVRMETYGCLVVEYWIPEYMEPFESLLKGK